MLQLEFKDKEQDNGWIAVTITNWSLVYTYKELDAWIEDTYGRQFVRCTPVAKHISIYTGLYIVKFKVKTRGS